MLAASSVRVAWLASATLLSLTTTSCLQLERQYVNTLSADRSKTREIQFDDVRVPHGMVLRTTLGESFSHEVGAFRWAHFVYDGEIPLDALSRRMVENLEQHDWRQTSDKRSSRDEQSMEFRRGDRTLVCLLQASGPRQSTLTIDLTTH